MPRKLTTEEFTEKAIAVHGDRWDYSRVVYIGSKSKIEITCRLHGVFWQSPNDHLSKGAGCPKCKIAKHIETRTYSTQDFITRAKGVHGNKYDYSKVVYRHSFKEVEIICPIHGRFWQKPVTHLQGSSCGLCGIDYRTQFNTLTFQEFLERSKEAHGDRYDYSKVIYTSCDDKVEIICPTHGSFWQNAKSHYLGFGCAKCTGKGKPTNDEFIQKSQKVHGDKYKYGKVDYLNSKTKVEITCPKHASFFQTPNDHLGGAGCPSCGRASTGEEAIAKVLQQWGIIFTRQKCFSECREKGYLPFDFYFRLRNVTFLVEYDGIQHFEPIEVFGGDDALERNRKHDRIKDQFAQDNGFHLIRIPYTEYDNIESILRNVIDVISQS